MEGMREIRGRIGGVQKTMKITQAMYLMASSKMKKARKRLLASEPYFIKLQATIADILARTQLSGMRYFDSEKNLPEDKVKRGFLVFTSDRGFVGAYNHDVIRLTETLLSCSKHNTLLFVGEAAHNYFLARPHMGVIQEEHSFVAAGPSIHRASGIADFLVEEFNKGNLDEILMVFSKNKNALTAKPESLQVLPLERGMFAREDSEEQKPQSGYEELYSPSPEAVLDRLVPNYVKGLIYGVMVETYASEQNARMITMDNATDNGKALVKKLTLLKNKLRQSTITEELAEVLSGANDRE